MCVRFWQLTHLSPPGATPIPDGGRPWVSLGLGGDAIPIPLMEGTLGQWWSGECSTVGDRGSPCFDNICRALIPAHPSSTPLRYPVHLHHPSRCTDTQLLRPTHRAHQGLMAEL
mmetsp:Transcript_69772/g.117165  ORF Transcript_69772/g.117165 Transcript_69772/m.117165 type:complete len:114 (-) Transcript_69772:212-553(-)